MSDTLGAASYPGNELDRALRAAFDRYGMLFRDLQILDFQHLNPAQKRALLEKLSEIGKSIILEQTNQPTEARNRTGLLVDQVHRILRGENPDLPGGPPLGVPGSSEPASPTRDGPPSSEPASSEPEGDGVRWWEWANPRSYTDPNFWKRATDSSYVTSEQPSDPYKDGLQWNEWNFPRDWRFYRHLYDSQFGSEDAGVPRSGPSRGGMHPAMRRQHPEHPSDLSPDRYRHPRGEQSEGHPQDFSPERFRHPRDAWEPPPPEPSPEPWNPEGYPDWEEILREEFSQVGAAPQINVNTDAIGDLYDEQFHFLQETGGNLAAFQDGVAGNIQGSWEDQQALSERTAISSGFNDAGAMNRYSESFYDGYFRAQALSAGISDTELNTIKNISINHLATIEEELQSQQGVLQQYGVDVHNKAVMSAVRDAVDEYNVQESTYQNAFATQVAADKEGNDLANVERYEAEQEAAVAAAEASLASGDINSLLALVGG